MLRVVGLDWPPKGADLCGYRLRAVAVHCEVFGTAGRDLVFTPASARALASLLREGAAAIDTARVRTGAA